MKRIVSFGFLMSLASHGFGKDTVLRAMHSTDPALVTTSPQRQNQLVVPLLKDLEAPGTSKHLGSAVESDLGQSKPESTSALSKTKLEETSKDVTAQASQSTLDAAEKSSEPKASDLQTQAPEGTKVAADITSVESQSSAPAELPKVSDPQTTTTTEFPPASQPQDDQTTENKSPSVSTEEKQSGAEKTPSASEAITKSSEGQMVSDTKFTSENKAEPERKSVQESKVVAENKTDKVNQEPQSLSAVEKSESETDQVSPSVETTGSEDNPVSETKPESYTAPVSTIDMGRTKAIYAEKDKSVNQFGSWMIQIGTGNKVNYSEIKRYKDFYGDFASTLDFGVDWNFVRTTYAGFGLGGRFSYYSDKGTRLKKDTAEKVQGDTTFAVNSGILALQGFASPFSGHWLVVKGWAGKQVDYFEESRDTDSETTTVSEAQDAVVLISKGKRNGLVKGAAVLFDLTWASSESLRSMKPSMGFDELYIGAFKESYSHLSTAGLNLSRDMTGLMLVFGSAY